MDGNRLPLRGQVWPSTFSHNSSVPASHPSSRARSSGGSKLTNITCRALAEHWETAYHPATSFYKNPLDQISMFVLLDLLGAPNPTVPSPFLPTHWAYRAMANIEQRMRDLGLLESKPNGPFLPDAEKEASKFGRGMIEDDHIPFMHRGVPILHLIATPFPDVWHTMNDDGAHLDMPTVRDWARIMTAFALEWLDMMEVEPKGEGPVST